MRSSPCTGPFLPRDSLGRSRLPPRFRRKRRSRARAITVRNAPRRAAMGRPSKRQAYIGSDPLPARAALQGIGAESEARTIEEELRKAAGVSGRGPSDSARVGAASGFMINVLEARLLHDGRSPPGGGVRLKIAEAWYTKVSEFKRSSKGLQRMPADASGRSRLSNPLMRNSPQESPKRRSSSQAGCRRFEPGCPLKQFQRLAPRGMTLRQKRCRDSHRAETSEAEASAEAANRSGMSTLRGHHMSGVGRIGFPSPAQVSHGAPILYQAPFEERPDELVDLLLNLD